ncbi:MAG: F0F1 ATP synthase subunit delta [Bacteroidaceae bacterium]|nr:F0F1 ATP synthase subunit delta [Bacteroidaceae bacterium]
MNTGVVSARYAKALYEYAAGLKAEDAMYSSMLQLLHTLQSVKEFMLLLRNPSLGQKERTDLLCSAVEPSPVFRNFARLVVKEEREELLLFIAHAYISLYRKEKGIQAVKFVTATPIGEESLDKVSRLISEKSGNAVEMESVVDPSITGGFIIETDSARFDASVQGQIREIRKLLVKKNRKLVQ